MYPSDDRTAAVSMLISNESYFISAGNSIPVTKAYTDSVGSILFSSIGCQSAFVCKKDVATGQPYDQCLMDLALSCDPLSKYFSSACDCKEKSLATRIN